MKKVFSLLRGGYIGLIFALLYLPVALMIILSFNASNSAYTWTGFSLWKYEKLFANEVIVEALGTTVLVGFISAALATVIGTLGCLGMLAMRKRLQKAVSTAVNIPLLNADIVTGVTLMLFFEAFVERSLGTLLVSHITLILPYVILNVYPKLTQLDNNVYEAALDLGASPAKAFFKVILPEIFPGVLTGFLLALTISLDDFTITFFTAGRGLNTLSTYIYNSYKIRGIMPEYYALTTLMFVAVLALILVVQVVNVRSAGKSAAAGDTSKKRI